MIKLRPFSIDDLIPLDILWQEHWSGSSLPNRHNAITDAVAENEKHEVVGYGQVKLFAEAMVFINPTSRQRDKAHALRQLMTKAFRDTRNTKIEEIYAFIKDPDFSLLIQERYGFKAIIEPGELLLRKL